MFLVTKRPKAVTRKLAIEIWFLSKGRYQGTGESAATSLSHTTLFSKRGKTNLVTVKVPTSKPASLSASMHSPVDLISGSPLPSSTSFWEHSNIIDDRPTNMGKIVKIRVIERAIESDPRPGRGSSEVKTDSFKPPLSRGDKGGSSGFPGGESLHGHGSVAAVAGVADGEGEGVAPVGACSDDLGNGGFSASDQFHGGAASGD
nr:hypothetical protein PanWU01x14_050790 [Ipomoea batatas]